MLGKCMPMCKNDFQILNERIKTGIFVVVSPLGSKMTEAATVNMFYRANAQTETSSNSFTRSSPFTYSPHSRSLSFQSFWQLLWVKLPLPGMTRFWCSPSVGCPESFKSNYDAGSTPEPNTGLKNFMEAGLRSENKEYYCLSGSQGKQLPLPIHNPWSAPSPPLACRVMASLLDHGSWDRLQQCRLLG